MRKKSENIKKIIEVSFVAILLTYGIHYFAYFLRARYFNALAPVSEANPGMFAILRYLGHLVFLVMFVLFVLAVKEDRKYLVRIIPKQSGNKVSLLLIGMLLGFAANALCVAAALFNGDISMQRATELNPLLFILAFIAVFIQSSVEEIESRAFLFGKLEDGGTPFVVAAILSSLFFSYIHATNPGFGLKPFISIFLVGLFYVLLYKYTGSLWITCGDHCLWNFTQDFIFGLPNSGNPSGMSFFTSTANSNSFFYDSEFGVEGGWLCMIVHIVEIIIVGYLLYRKNHKVEKQNR